MSWRYYDLFISHAWKYDDRYKGIVRLLESWLAFYWRDYSAPKGRPLVHPDTPVGQRELTQRLDEQIRQASCFVISAGMYVNHRAWVLTELDIARAYGKPVVAVKRLGASRVPVELHDADATVAWRAESLVKAIRKVSRPRRH